MAAVPQNYIEAKRREYWWRNVMMDKFVLKFNSGYEWHSLIWISNPIANDIKVKFVNWLFPEPLKLATLDDIQDAPVDKDKVVMIGPILSDIDDEVMAKLERVASIAKNQKAKIIITSPRSILDSMVSSLEVADLNKLAVDYHEMLLSDEVLLTGGIDQPKNREQLLDILKDNLIKHLKDFKPIWMTSDDGFINKGEFLEKLFPGDVEITTINKLTNGNNPLQDKILMVDFTGSIEEDVYATLISAADIAEQQEKGFIVFASQSFEDGINPSFSVARLVQLKDRFREEFVDDDLLDD